MAGGIEVIGLKEFNLAVRRSVDVELPKRIGEANKRIGALVVSKLQPRPDPAAVGTGAGSSVRPSASKREVLLRVGGSHRSSGEHTRKQPWGKRRVTPPGRHAPDRPNILGTVEAHQDQIERAWLVAISDAMEPAFYRTEP